MNDYEILGVNALDDDETVRKAYIRLAKKYHPDNSSNAENMEILKRINTAYSNIKKTRIGLRNDRSGERNIYGQSYPKFNARKSFYAEKGYYTTAYKKKSSGGMKPAVLILILLLIFFALRLLLLAF